MAQYRWSRRDTVEDSVNPEDIKYKDKNTKIIYKGELVDYPFQTNIHQLEKEEFESCFVTARKEAEKAFGDGTM